MEPLKIDFGSDISLLVEPSIDEKTGRIILSSPKEESQANLALRAGVFNALSEGGYCPVVLNDEDKALMWFSYLDRNDALGGMEFIYGYLKDRKRPEEEIAEAKSQIKDFLRTQYLLPLHEYIREQAEALGATLHRLYGDRKDLRALVSALCEKSDIPSIQELILDEQDRAFPGLGVHAGSMLAELRSYEMKLANANRKSDILLFQEKNMAAVEVMRQALPAELPRNAGSLIHSFCNALELKGMFNQILETISDIQNRNPALYLWVDDASAVKEYKETMLRFEEKLQAEAAGRARA